MFLVVLVIVLMFASQTSKDKKLNDKAGIPAQVQPAELERPQEVVTGSCADLASFPEGAGSAGELCDRYYKSRQCRAEIESKFQKWQLQIAPAVACGSPLKKRSSRCARRAGRSRSAIGEPGRWNGDCDGRRSRCCSLHWTVASWRIAAFFSLAIWNSWT